MLDDDGEKSLDPNADPPKAKVPITSITLFRKRQQKQYVTDSRKRYRLKITPDNARWTKPLSRYGVAAVVQAVG